MEAVMELDDVKLMVYYSLKDLPEGLRVLAVVVGGRVLWRGLISNSDLFALLGLTGQNIHITSTPALTEVNPGGSPSHAAGFSV